MRTRYLFGEKTVSNIETSIMLRYYILDSEFDNETDCKQWGIEVESHTGGICEFKRINYLCEDYNKMIDMIRLLLENEVTPACLYEVMEEIL